jgi:hypothetical protein
MRMPTDTELRKRGLAAHLRHGPGVGDPSSRIELGEVETSRHGRVRVFHDTGDHAISGSGVTAPLDEIDPELRAAFISSAAYLNAAQDAQAQAAARTLIGLVVDAVLQRDASLTVAVQRQKNRERQRR